MPVTSPADAVGITAMVGLITVGTMATAPVDMPIAAAATTNVRLMRVTRAT